MSRGLYYGILAAHNRRRCRNYATIGVYNVLPCEHREGLMRLRRPLSVISSVFALPTQVYRGSRC